MTCQTCCSQAPRSRRHRQVEVDLISSQAGPAPSSRHSRAVKPSLKARTNENVHISGIFCFHTAERTLVGILVSIFHRPDVSAGGVLRYVTSCLFICSACQVTCGRMLQCPRRSRISVCWSLFLKVPVVPISLLKSLKEFEHVQLLFLKTQF